MQRDFHHGLLDHVNLMRASKANAPFYGRGAQLDVRERKPGRRATARPQQNGRRSAAHRSASRVTSYVTGGGSLFLVMDQDMWSTLEQTNVNDVIRPFGIQFGGESPDSAAGGHTKAGVMTDQRLKISYHG